MYFNHFVYFLLILPIGLFAQSDKSGQITGKLVKSEDDTPLDFATVSVYNSADTSLINYTLTEDDGSFEIDRLPLGTELRLIISYLGYKPVKEDFILHEDTSHKEWSKIGMEISAQHLEEVLVEAERPPIIVKNDTLEFNAASFTTRDGAVVEDLVKQLPGVFVDNEGKVFFNGKEVKKVRVDGNDFFGGDPRVALRNLTADMIDKVQIADDREEDPENLLTEDEVEKVINLKLKKEAKIKAFGKVYAGGGTRDRFELGGIVNSFRDTLQVSLLGYFNNLKKTNLSMEEVMSLGGFGRRTSMRVSPDGAFGINGIDFGSYGNGLPKGLLGGTNINYTLGKAKLDLQYFYSENELVGEKKTNKEQILNNDSTFYYDALNNTRSRSINHNLGAGIRWEIDTMTRLNLNIDYKVSNSDNPSTNSELTYNGVQDLLQRNITEERPQSDNNSLSSYIYFSRKMNNKGRLVSFRTSYRENRNVGMVFSDFQRIFYANPVDSMYQFLQQRNQDQSSQYFNSHLNFTEPLIDNWTLSISGSVNLQNQRNDILTSQRSESMDPWVEVDDLGNSFRRNEKIYAAGANLRYRKDKLQFSAGINHNWLSYKNIFSNDLDNINAEFAYWSPSMNISYGGWRLSYYYQMRTPQVSELHPAIDNTNPLYIRRGNPDLDPFETHSVYMSNHSFKGKWRYTTYLNGQLSENPVVWRTSVDNQGVTTSAPINFGTSKSLYGNFSLIRNVSMENSKINFNPSVYLNGRSSPFIINNKEGITNSFNVGLTAKIGYSYKNLFDFSPNYRLNFNTTNYIDLDYRNVKYHSHQAGAEMTLHLPWGMSFENDLSYVYNPQVGPGFDKSQWIWHAAINKKILKSNRGTLRISAFDVLNQNTAIRRFVSFNTITDQQELTLQQYFIMTFIYDFRGKKEEPKEKGSSWWDFW